MASFEGAETAIDFLSGGGEVGNLIGAFDWSKTSLGPLASWPQPIRTTLGLVLGAPMPILTLWGDEGIMIYNDAYARFAGGRHPALLGQRVREGWSEVSGFNDRVMKMVLAGGVLSYRDQEMHLNRSGVPEQVWLNLDYSPVLDEAGTPIGVFALVVETTSRIVAERELRLEERQREAERLRQLKLFEQAPGFITIMRGPDHVVEFVNGEHQKLFGSAGWVGLPAREAIPSIAGQGFFEDLDQVYQTGKTISGQGQKISYQLTPDSPLVERYLTLMYAPLYDDDGVLSGVFVEGFDVTETVLAEAALRRNEARLRFLDALNRATMQRTDADAILAVTTRMLGEHMGASVCAYADMDADQDGFTIRGDWAAPGTRSIVGHYSLAAFGELAVQKLGAGEPLVLNDNAAELPPEAAATFLSIGLAATICMPLVKDGRLTALVAVHDKAPRQWTTEDLALLNEVTERSWAHIERVRAEAEKREGEQRFLAELEAKVAERTAALQQAQKMEAIGQLTGGVAHDFNNLLMAVSGSLELLRKRVPAEEGVLKLIDNASEATRRGSSLTRRMLAFARRQDLKSERVELHELVDGMTELLSRSLGPMVAIEAKFPKRLPPVEIDPNQLESALLNLMVNARDAMNGEGRITISGREEIVDTGDRALTPGRYVCLTVTDTGPGMDEATLKRATEPFFTTKGVGEGTGLGLSMVLGFAEQSGGTLRLRSRQGEGTTAEIWLRAAGESARPAPKPVVEEPLPPMPARLSILAVDDDALVLMNTVAMLEDLGHDVTAAYSAREALEAMQGRKFDLVVTDHAMPQMTGAQLAGHIREAQPAMPIVLATGYAEIPPGPGQALPRLSKPFSMADLAAAVSRATAWRPGVA
jgi:signal transduction histidine kinase/CheY-like chemotaxis protein